MCHQTVALVQGALEQSGIPSVSISMMPEITEAVGVSRVLQVPFALGFPLGEPGNAELQRDVVAQALELLRREDVPVSGACRLQPAD